ncbi:polyprenyl synthetase family protein [Streptococcus ictaluri]|uniref:Farnesyl diphosphate synthase n=1 Tax=Streptococcus ictaluri 707-05 TaxID=764299 RepID=G5K5S4_9STRE|nr:farnesyl diphosphate synthase [Streptococcus ictaluri]EHI68619.1 polyprenyl synthetase [Streptococcus ictaluri 707-05]
MISLNKIDEAIHDYYQKSHSQVSTDLIEAILYSVNGGGKRIRPRILLELLEGFEITLTESHYMVAAALEMIHTGSLIHDDLPAMDNDDYRRGRLTNHKQFDEATAILAGDALFLDPFDVLVKAHLKAEVTLHLVTLLSSSAGSFGMVGGQMLDMKGEEKSLSLLDLTAIHTNKTGKLLAFPFLAAAIIAEASEKVCGQFWQVGMLVGHAFQVRDDILDLTASFDQMGKTPQKDIASQKSTYPSLLGLEESYAVLKDSLTQAKDLLEQIAQETNFNAQEIVKLIEGLRLDA